MEHCRTRESGLHLTPGWSKEDSNRRFLANGSVSSAERSCGRGEKSSLEDVVFLRGTEGSNPASSIGESIANLTFSIRGDIRHFPEYSVESDLAQGCIP